MDQRLLNALNNRRWLRSADQLPTLYLTNHEDFERGLAGRGPGQCGRDRWLVQDTALRHCAVHVDGSAPGSQRAGFGEDHFLPEDDQNTGRRVIPGPLRWKLSEENGSAQRCAATSTAHSPACAWSIRRCVRRRCTPSSREEWQTQFSPVGVGIDVARQAAGCPPPLGGTSRRRGRERRHRAQLLQRRAVAERPLPARRHLDRPPRAAGLRCHGATGARCRCRRTGDGSSGGTSSLHL